MALLNTADKIYLGTSIVDKVYLGANLVWPTTIITNYWPTGNCASPTPNEANAIPTTTSNNGATLSSVSGGTNGSFCLRSTAVISSSGDWKSQGASITGLTINSKYTVTLDIRNVNGSNPAVYMTGGVKSETGITILTAETSWQTKTLLFTAAATTAVMSFYCVTTGVGKGTYYTEYDNIRVNLTSDL